MATRVALPLARSGEPRTRAALLLEAVALRHQIAVLERCGTRRPCFRRWDRRFWILFSRWWPHWRDSLIVVQPDTVLRWRRDGWLALWRYRLRPSNPQPLSASRRRPKELEARSQEFRTPEPAAFGRIASRKSMTPLAPKALRRFILSSGKRGLCRSSARSFAEVSIEAAARA